MSGMYIQKRKQELGFSKLGFRLLLNSVRFRKVTWLSLTQSKHFF